MHDPFNVLGLSRTASPTEVKRAFRRLAMHWHPDRNATREAEERFKQIKAAYELILDPERLAAWDAKENQARTANEASRKKKTANPSPEDANTSTDTDAAASSDTSHITLHLELEEAAFGCTKTIRLLSEHPCAECHGRGQHEHSHSLPCSDCHGVGHIRSGRTSHACTTCAGRGYVRITRCSVCDGSGWKKEIRHLEVRIPAGMLPGERLRLARQYHPREGAPVSDLFIAIAIHPHPLLSLEGCHLECSVPVSIFRLLHGGEIEIPTLGGTQFIPLNAYPAHPLEYLLPGLGYPGRHGRAAGHLHVHLRAVYPSSLDEAERKLLARLDKAMQAQAAHIAPELAAWETCLRNHYKAT